MMDSLNSYPDSHPIHHISITASGANLDLRSDQLAAYLDQHESVQSHRSHFHIPTRSTTSSNHDSSKDAVVYLCGNSLGLQPKQTANLVAQEMQVWATHGVTGHFDHPFGRNWASIDTQVTAELTKLVGGIESNTNTNTNQNEVVAMGSLTCNLHLLMVPFYRPTADRFKILMESKAFPSDIYAIESQVRFHAYDPEVAIVTLSPEDPDSPITIDDIRKVMESHSICLCLLPGVQYYTGQLFDMKNITAMCQSYGSVVGWDLAHAIGNVDLHLHAWNVDFAVWCSYKYLNSGPGGIAGLFVHANHHATIAHRFAGWWGHNRSTRFLMPNKFDPIPGAYGFQLSNPCVLSMICLLGSLNVFKMTSMHDLRSKSIRLTGYLEYLVMELVAGNNPNISIITPKDPNQRGAQLSIMFKNWESMDPLVQLLESHNVIVDARQPNVLRVAPAPLYNTYTDICQFIGILKLCLKTLSI